MKTMNSSKNNFVRIAGSVLAVLVFAGAFLVQSEEPKSEQSKAGKSQPAKFDPAAIGAENARFEARFRKIQQGAMKTMYAELGKGAVELQKEFPQKAEVYQLLIEVASRADVENARKCARLVLDHSTSDEMKEAAKSLMRRLDAVGKPLDIKFTAVDGREVDVAQMKNKVILVDFWATWCLPCVQEIPHIKATYEKYHGKGFEVVGISFDEKKYMVESFVTEKGVGWPQYFDGSGWGNKFGRDYGISSLPTMWLVDKKGNLRDIEAQDGLEEKIEKLLAEK